ncbi:major facilitator superfamily MFS_1 (plasmid) [Nitratidesulfovibrio vulgaris DP4]|uniref:Major facilitator superfamily MFS_1 n=2 Tax=Nitratidesulfovibrio vulgaris TaxID=881 RepID=A0A0H3AC15_NITV4|nr:major facilitator superfamily MFS_1 [Nitratidesulfovibrio vulgaris DP4]
MPHMTANPARTLRLKVMAWGLLALLCAQMFYGVLVVSSLYRQYRGPMLTVQAIAGDDLARRLGRMARLGKPLDRISHLDAMLAPFRDTTSATALYVTDATGAVLAAWDADTVLPRLEPPTQTSPVGVTGAQEFRRDEATWLVSPILGKDGDLVGRVLLRTDPQRLQAALRDAASYLPLFASVAGGSALLLVVLCLTLLPASGGGVGATGTGQTRQTGQTGQAGQTQRAGRTLDARQWGRRARVALVAPLLVGQLCCSAALYAPLKGLHQRQSADIAAQLAEQLGRDLTSIVHKGVALGDIPGIDLHLRSLQQALPQVAAMGVTDTAGRLLAGATASTTLTPEAWLRLSDDGPTGRFDVPPPPGVGRAATPSPADGNAQSADAAAGEPVTGNAVTGNAAAGDTITGGEATGGGEVRVLMSGAAIRTGLREALLDTATVAVVAMLLLMELASMLLMRAHRALDGMGDAAHAPTREDGTNAPDAPRINDINGITHTPGSTGGTATASLTDSPRLADTAKLMDTEDRATTDNLTDTPPRAHAAGRATAHANLLAETPGFMRPVIFFCMFAIDMGVSFIPLRLAELDATLLGLPRDVVMGLPVSAEMFMVAVAILLGGAAGERFGWRPLLLCGVLLAALGNLVSGTAASALGYIAARGIAGAGYGCINLAAQLHVMNHSDESNRAGNLAHMFAGLFAGAMCGSATGGLVADRLGYGPVFFVAAGMLLAVLGVLALCPARPHVPALGSRPAPHPGQTPEATSLDTAHDADGNAAGVLAFLRDRRMVGLLVCNIMPVAFVTVCLFQFFIPVYLSEGGASPADIGRVSMLFCLVVVFLGPLCGRLIDATPRKDRMLVVAGIAGALAIAALLMGGGIAEAVLAVVMLGVSNAIAASAQGTYALSLPVALRMGRARTMGVYNITERVGQVIGPVTFAVLLSLLGREGGLLAMAAGVAALTLLFMWLSGGDTARTAADATAVTTTGRHSNT